MKTVLRTQGRRVAALVLIGACYLLARLPELPAGERRQLAAQFRFERSPLPALSHPPYRSVRPVNPSLERISAWVSSVGASVALHDLDGDGLPNDVCYVDVRTDEVIVAPAPGLSGRYPAFVLDPKPLRVDATMAPMGCLPGDVDEDGQADLLIYYWGRSPILFLQDNLRFRPVEIDPRGERWYSNAATFADLDGDGHPDLVVGNYFADGARILDARAAEPDHMQHSMSRALNAGRNRILLWTDGRFVEVPDALPDDVAHGWTLAAGAADLDGDLLPEIYFANDFGPDRLLHNQSTPGHLRFRRLEGVRTLTTPNSKVLGHDSFKGMGVDFADLNGDLIPDIFVSNIAAPYALEESHFLFLSSGRKDLIARGIAPYSDQSEPLGLSRSSWGWDCKLADFNNDGIVEAIQAVGFVKGERNRWPELHELAMGNDDLLRHPGSWPRFQPGDSLSGTDHNPFFVRSQSGRYFDLASEIGLAEPHVSRGIAIADVDGDGRLDFAVANQWEPSLFFANRGPKPGPFLGLRLRYPSGRAAIGATARLKLPAGITRTGQVDGGNGHSGRRSPDLHFGLPASEPVEVEIRWRDRDGLHTRSETLAPGWHTIVLEKSSL